jgi:alpha 1,6-mannosyltransferase
MPSNIIDVYMSMPKAILKADLFRYIAVLVLGGVYSDEDTECLRPIDTWIYSQCKHVRFIVGLEFDKPTRYLGFTRPLQFCQWTFASVSDHQILRNVVNKIVALTPQMLARNMSYALVMNWTGPGMWTDVILDHLRDYHKVNTSDMFINLRHPVLIGDIYIFPIYTFAIGENAKVNQNLEVHVRHKFRGRWKKDNDMIKKPRR